tara:strand:+ start:388 stop:903 length:516 start_codon:yes stop_codon:yes gene_type:complete
MILKIIPYIHLLFILFITIYPIIFNYKYLIDYIYINLLFITHLSWTLNNNECLISYIYKKNKNKNYLIGTNSLELDDIFILINKNLWKKYISKILYLLSIYSSTIVFIRNNIPLIFIIFYNILLFLYLSLIRNLKNIKYIILKIFKIYIFLILIFYNIVFFENNLYKDNFN